MTYCNKVCFNRDSGHGITQATDIKAKDEENELFFNTLQNQCNEGEAYCWSICQSLPTDCKQIREAVCIDGHMLRCK